MLAFCTVSFVAQACGEPARPQAIAADTAEADYDYF